MCSISGASIKLVNRFLYIRYDITQFTLVYSMIGCIWAFGMISYLILYYPVLLFFSQVTSRIKYDPCISSWQTLYIILHFFIVFYTHFQLYDERRVSRLRARAELIQIPNAIRWPINSQRSAAIFIRIEFPGKFCNRLLTEILTEVPISHSLTEFNQPFNR